MYSVQSPAPITCYKSSSGLSDTRQDDHHSVTLASAPVPAAGPTGSVVRESRVFGQHFLVSSADVQRLRGAGPPVAFPSTWDTLQNAWGQRLPVLL